MGEASSAVQAGAAGVTGEVKTTAAQKFLDTLKSALTWLREKVFSPILRTLAEALKNALRDAAAVTGGVRELGIAVGRRVSGAISQGIGGSVGAMGGPDRGSETSTISDIPLVPADPAPVRDL
ncbi:MAG: hypothetical protein LBT57_03465 [Puniceicoccales bacterium]|nr:hypothetical protein [Puniceicoccales bacterium]